MDKIESIKSNLKHKYVVFAWLKIK